MVIFVKLIVEYFFITHTSDEYLQLRMMGRNLVVESEEEYQCSERKNVSKVREKFGRDESAQ